MDAYDGKYENENEKMHFQLDDSSVCDISFRRRAEEFGCPAVEVCITSAKNGGRMTSACISEHLGTIVFVRGRGGDVRGRGVAVTWDSLVTQGRFSVEEEEEL